MVPVPISARNSHSSRLLYILFSLTTNYAPRIFRRPDGVSNVSLGTTLVRRKSEFDPHKTKSIVFVVLIPILVLLSGLFAGLTLGYMSLDETQLNVLSISGTPDQRKYANKIMPIRKNGHLLLVTLLLANMIVNESLPVIADPILGGGFQSVVVSTVLIVIFSEIIPQSLFTRHGLYLGAKMAGFTKFLIYAMGIISWPVAKLLEFVLGPHHGIIYRRAELKELIAMHSSHATHGGDLKLDTVTIIGATLDLQEKVVKQAMTPISDVFMLSIDSKLDYALLKKICQTGHSRVPVYEEVEVPLSVVTAADETPLSEDKQKQRTMKVKKIIGILLVKQCVLLDPKDATPLRKIPLNKVPFVPNNEPLLGILDKFQEGRSHMAIVSRFSVDKAASVKKAVKLGLTQRLRKRVGMDTDSDTESSDEEKEKNFTADNKKRGRRKLIHGLIRKSSQDTEGTASDTAKEDAVFDVATALNQTDLEKGNGAATSAAVVDGTSKENGTSEKNEKTNTNEAGNPGLNPNLNEEVRKSKITSLQLPKLPAGMTSMSMLEQSMPADAVLAKEGAAEFLQGFDPAVMPLGIITLEDVLEELIGEEIYDEFDTQGAHGDPYEVPPAVFVHDFEGDSGAALASHGAGAETPHTRSSSLNRRHSGAGGGGGSNQGHGHVQGQPIAKTTSALTAQMGMGMPTALKGLGFFRTKSAPPVPREERNTSDDPVGGGSKTVRISEGHTDNNLRPESNTNTHSTPIQMPKPIRSPGRHPPSIILEQHSSVSSSDSSDGVSLSFMPVPIDTVAPASGATAGTAAALPSSAVVSSSSAGTGSSTPQLPSASILVSSSPPVPTGSGAGTVPAPAVQPHKLDMVPSRNASPAPTLEAILLDRKRRLAAAHVQGPGSGSSSGTPALPVTAGGAAGGGSNMTTAPSPAPSIVINNLTTSPPPMSPAPSIGAGGGGSGSSMAAGVGSARSAHGHGHGGVSKGTRFKSSPLGGGERAGVVVAEQVKGAYAAGGGGGGKDGEEEQLGLGLANGKEDGNVKKVEEGRITGEMEKAGPDKA